MPGTRDRKEFGQPFDHAEDQCLEEIAHPGPKPK
jgi:hypothetical protein